MCKFSRRDSTGMSAIVLALILWSLLKYANATDECPTGCWCGFTSWLTEAIIDCRESPPDVDEEQLLRQFDSLLSAKHIVERLTSLRIKYTPLTRVPQSVCQLLNLTSLQFYGNNITRLPDNCFTNLANLVTLSLCGNSIEGLQDGLFDGLQNLETLDLSINQISFIGLRVFSNASDLTDLRTLYLNDNKLTSLEPWWYYRCLKSYPVDIVLRNNRISNFTNELQFNFQCNMKKPYGYVSLDNNRIAHIMDIFRGWNITDIDTLLCLSILQHPGGNSPRPMGFYMYGSNYSCDCIDFPIYKWVKETAPTTSLLQVVYCTTEKFQNTYGQQVLASSIPLNDFVCERQDGCPSSCRCAYRPGNSTLHVDCSAANLSSLPLALPPLPNNYTMYQLDFSNNKLLRRLEHRQYFVNTSILGVSNCSLTEITAEILPVLSRFGVASFRGNVIESFPRQAETANISGRLLLGLNPWKCSCDNSWMIEWLHSLSDQISDPGDIICTSPPRLYDRNVLKSTEYDFCVDPVLHTLMITLSVVAAVITIVATVVVLTYKLREKFYKRWKIHPFDRDECIGEDMDYDVFLCCSSLDHRPHAVRILKLIESNGYRVCYHEWDFLPGSLITDNMIRSVERSKRTVCLISNNFLKSPYCMTEFNMAYHHNVVVKRKERLIALMMLDNPTDLCANEDSDTVTLRQYLGQYTYIDYKADDWLDKLLYALPLHGLLQSNEDNEDNIQLVNVQVH